MISPLAPRRLRPDNFTPPSRTPWGGTKIRAEIKAGQRLAPGSAVVGESWEISVEPSFPSRTEEGDLLVDVIGEAPEAWLGAEDAGRYGQLPLLVKLLDAADDLSVQVHPADGDPALAEDESGKPEAWIVLDAEPGAGLYLGFRDGVSRSDVEACLLSGGRLDGLMTFVEVSAGDAFVIAAGTVHAIGAGVTLVEPQLVRPGRRGLTYRYWDWNRRYDGNGKRDPAGRGRELHIERSLAVTDWSARAEGCKSAPERLNGGSLRRERVIAWPWFDVERWQGRGAFEVPGVDRLLAICCLRGELSLTGATGALTLTGGQSAVVPAAAGHVAVEGRDALAFATRCA